MQNHPKDPWYEIEEGDERITLRFCKPECGFWTPAILNAFPLPDFPAEKPVAIEGRAAVWMYAHAGAHLAHQGVELCRLQNATSTSTGGDLSRCINEFKVAENDRIALITMDWDTPATLSDEDQETLVDQLAQRAADHPTRPVLLITGKAECHRVCASSLSARAARISILGSRHSSYRAYRDLAIG
ncbi:MAG: hypothetical protein KatS3mg105_5152 [Gemmatales bacterium]|nr:MAG: hypothetical protein KatS3mg105_5152 [Gemmatales bacterium]GIW97837.1 MAG: hypothetical protein KatS3mg111_1170 [Pirellulaceae bacterium]